jgi:AmiR/NasT family two-component response regulator
MWAEIVRTGLLEPSEVHQATGMVIGQLGISPTDALARLRIFADMAKQPTSHIAEMVIDRSLRFGTDGAITP